MSETYFFRRLTRTIGLALVSMLSPDVGRPDDTGVRIGPAVAYLLDEALSVPVQASDALDGFARVIPHWILDTLDCSALLATPWEKTPTINQYTDTWVRMGAFRAGCWAFTQVPGTAHVAPATLQDGITRAMTDALMTYLLEKSATDDEWRKTFTAFPGGDLTCKTPWSCTLTLPDGKVYPEQYLYIDLILAFGNRRYLEVTEAVYGSPRFVYGVELDLNDGAPRVVSLNFVPS